MLVPHADPSCRWEKAANGFGHLANLTQASSFIASQPEQLGLVPEEGDMMAFLSQVSDDLVRLPRQVHVPSDLVVLQLEAGLDLDLNADKRDVYDYQTRKLGTYSKGAPLSVTLKFLADDEALENGITCRFAPLEPVDVALGLAHRQTGLTERLMPTFDAVLGTLGSGFSPELLRQLLERVAAAGVDGIPQAHLYGLASEQHVDALVAHLLIHPEPPFLQVGYQTRLLVSVAHLRYWALGRQSRAGSTYFVPRVWLDLHGSLIQETARQCCQAVLTAIHMHTAPSAVRLSLIHNRPAVETETGATRPDFGATSQPGRSR